MSEAEKISLRDFIFQMEDRINKRLDAIDAKFDSALGDITKLKVNVAKQEEIIKSEARRTGIIMMFFMGAVSFAAQKIISALI